MQVASLYSGLSPSLISSLISSSLPTRAGSDQSDYELHRFVVELNFFEGIGLHTPTPWPVSYPGRTQRRLLQSTFIKRLGQLFLVWGTSDEADLGSGPRVVVLFLNLGNGDMSNEETAFEVPGVHFDVSATSSIGI